MFLPHSRWHAPFWAVLSVQFSHSVVSDSLRPHRPQHTRPPCPSPTPGVYPNSCPLSQWCHPTISSSVVSISPSNEHPGLISFRMDYLIEVFKCLPETKSDWRIFSTSSLGDLIPISPRKPSKFFPGIMSSSGKLTAKTVSCDSRNKKKLLSNWSSLWI